MFIFRTNCKLVDIRQLTDPLEFLALSQSALEKKAALNNLLLGLPLRFAKLLSDGKEITEDHLRMAVVKREGKAVVGMLQTPPRHILLWMEEGEGEAMGALANWLKEKGWDFPGVNAEVEVAEAFAEVWEGNDFVQKVTNLGYELQEVIPARSCAGDMRVGNVEDVDLGAKWLGEFVDEALGDMADSEPRDAEQERKAVQGWVDRGFLHFWENGETVCMASLNRPMENGITVSYVYTPPEHRGKGYASNLVADLSQKMLDQGRRWVALFADGKNPTSNKIYQNIGYKLVGEMVVFQKV